jgi:hypothetical protein
MKLVYKRTVGRRFRKVETWYGQQTDSSQFDHPWKTTVTHEGGGWAVQVKPGFVNGVAPVWQRAKKDKEGNIETPAVTLLDNPLIPISESALGEGTELSKTDEKFFERMGVNLRESVSFDAANLSISIDQTQRAGAGTRTLKKAQVYLAQARPTYKLDTLIIGNLVTGDLYETNVALDLSTIGVLGMDPLIRAGVMPTKTLAAGSMAGLSAGQPVATEDDGVDYLLIATVYFISPEDGGDDQPGPGWQTYVKHNLFWNLFYNWKNDRPYTVPRLQLDPFLAFFVGRFTAAPAAALGALESITQSILTTAMNSKKNLGKFWSA